MSQIRFVRLTRQVDGSPVRLRAETIVAIYRADVRPWVNDGAGNIVQHGDRPQWGTIVVGAYGEKWLVSESVDDATALAEGRKASIDDPPEIAIAGVAP